MGPRRASQPPGHPVCCWEGRDVDLPDGGPTMLPTALLASLFVTGGPPGGPGPPRTVERLLQEKGPPLLSAHSLSLQGKRLVAKELDLADPSAKPRAFRGRALVYCEDGWEALGLAASLVGSKMSRATPLLGWEGPGANFLTAGAGKNTGAVELPGPVRLLVFWVDAAGRVRRTQAATVTEVQLADGQRGPAP